MYFVPIFPVIDSFSANYYPHIAINIFPWKNNIPKSELKNISKCEILKLMRKSHHQSYSPIQELTIFFRFLSISLFLPFALCSFHSSSILLSVILVFSHFVQSQFSSSAALPQLPVPSSHP
jgi:hypothetical protein